MAERTERDNDPDVVMFGYEWSYPDGRIVPDPKTAAVLGHPHRLSPEQRIPLLRILPVAWNKAYRREYLLAQYDRVFRYLGDHPELEAWRRPLFDRVAWHLPALLENSARIVPADRQAYFETIAAAIRRHRPAGYRPRGRLGLKVWLLEPAGYQPFRLAQALNRVRRQLTRGTNRPAR